MTEVVKLPNPSDQTAINGFIGTLRERGVSRSDQKLVLRYCWYSCICRNDTDDPDMLAEELDMYYEKLEKLSFTLLLSPLLDQANEFLKELLAGRKTINFQLG